MRGLGAAFGPGFPLSLITVIVPARQREPLIATSPVWPTHLDRTQPEPESYRRQRTHRDERGFDPRAASLRPEGGADQAEANRHHRRRIARHRYRS